MEYDRNQWCPAPPPTQTVQNYQNGYETQNGFLTALQGEYPPQAPPAATVAPPPPCYPEPQQPFENDQMISMNGYYHQGQNMVNNNGQYGQIPAQVTQNVQTVDESLSSLLQTDKEQYYDPYNQYESQYYYNHEYYYQDEYHFYQNYGPDQSNIVYNNYPANQMEQPTVPLPPPPPGPMPPVSSAPPEASKRTYDCTICAAKFDHHYALKRHMRRRDHLNEKTFKCKVCGVAFTLEQNLTRHYQTSHKKSDDTNQAINGMPSVMAVMAETNHSRKLSDLVSGLMELFECGTCNEVFTKYEQYRAHVTSSHPELKRFTCPHRACSDAFDQLEALIDHVKKTHAQVKPEPGTKRLRCTMCSKEFTRSDALRRHWRVHEREKRLPCPFNKILKCGQTFYRMDALKRHLETHKNPKFLVSTLSCDHCQKLFRSQAELERHRNLAHQTRQHQCDSCGKGFAKAHALRVHSCPVKQEAKVKRSKAAKKSWQRRAFGRRIDKQPKPPSEESTAPDQTLMLMEDEEETDLIIDETVS